jgi:hypothetical protein
VGLVALGAWNALVIALASLALVALGAYRAASSHD